MAAPLPKSTACELFDCDTNQLTFTQEPNLSHDGVYVYVSPFLKHSVCTFLHKVKDDNRRCDIALRQVLVIRGRLYKAEKGVGVVPEAASPPSRQMYSRLAFPGLALTNLGHEFGRMYSPAGVSATPRQSFRPGDTLLYSAQSLLELVGAPH